MSSFEDFVDLDGLDPEEQSRLRRVHELLVEAGPPPELSARLAALPPGVTRARIMPFPQARRRIAAGLALAAALAATAFGGGYLVGHQSPGGHKTVRVVAMTGQNALGSVRVGAPDAGGNWPIELRVTGLPKQAGQYAYYELFVLRHGEPGFPCGGFRVLGAGTTKATFSVPYKVESTTRWVLTAVDKTHHWPGRVVMT
jgi:hypothetical protein